MNEDQIERVRRICTALPQTTERLSHGEPTFFVHKKVFVMFANNHHNDGHIAVWLPAPDGFQAGLIEEAPQIFFKPPYVGVRGWLGINLDCVNDADLKMYIHIAWELIAPKRLRAQRETAATAQE
ncbi:MAG: MmcQ/YjbR family DNA-binding protein [Roseiflexaceae bacterium]